VSKYKKLPGKKAISTVLNLLKLLYHSDTGSVATINEGHIKSFTRENCHLKNLTALLRKYEEVFRNFLCAMIGSIFKAGG